LSSPETGVWYLKPRPPTTEITEPSFPGPKGLKKIIVTGDDFGLALPVNEAVIEAHRDGILTAASLMVGEKSCEDAVKRARQNPSLRVGLHVTLVEGVPVLNPCEIPDLVNSNGEFSTDLVRAGFRFFFLPKIRKQLENEIRAQFEAFKKTGLDLDHADAHNHMHLHPTILRLILKVGREYGLKAVRVPYEPPIRAWKASGKFLRQRIASWMFLSPWISLMKCILHHSHIHYNDYLFGMNDSGAMTEDLMLRFLENLPEGVTEFCFHPAARRCAEIDKTMPEYQHEGEFRTLISTPLLKAMHARNIERIAFSDL
jgi:chitin disaccharide deacetylase